MVQLFCWLLNMGKRYNYPGGCWIGGKCSIILWLLNSPKRLNYSGDCWIVGNGSTILVAIVSAETVELFWWLLNRNNNEPLGAYFIAAE